jgi:hypothetical protein
MTAPITLDMLRAASSKEFPSSTWLAPCAAAPEGNSLRQGIFSVQRRTLLAFSIPDRDLAPVGPVSRGGEQGNRRTRTASVQRRLGN